MPQLRVAGPLRLFLPPRERGGLVDVPHRPTDSLGHMVQAAGVPLTEVGELRVDAPHRPAASSVVEVLPRKRPQPLDGPPRVLLDVHLGALGRWLGLLGVDAAYRNDDDDELVAWAQDEDRLLLTQDRGLRRRRAPRRAAYVRGIRPDAQLADVLDRFRLPLAPYTLCTAVAGRSTRSPSRMSSTCCSRARAGRRSCSGAASGASACTGAARTPSASTRWCSGARVSEQLPATARAVPASCCAALAGRAPRCCRSCSREAGCRW